MRRILFTASALALALSCSAPLRAQQYGEAPVASPVIELHSGFWINLHHFLYLEARLRNAAADPADRESQAQPEYASSPPAGDFDARGTKSVECRAGRLRPGLVRARPAAQQRHDHRQ